MHDRVRYFVSPNEEDDSWTVKAERGEMEPLEFDTKKEAVDFARQIAREHGFSQLIIQRSDGTFEEERTYGEDPYPPEG